MTSSKPEVIYVDSSFINNKAVLRSFIVDIVVSMNLSTSYSLNLIRWLYEIQEKYNFSSEEELLTFMRLGRHISHSSKL